MTPIIDTQGDFMETTFKVKGMHCKSCDILIKEAVEELPGVKEVHADFRTGKVRIKHSGASIENIKAAIMAEGYKV
ncbi:MAG: heavy metal-associated domain-containing protein [Nanoarchaeota archaeon]